MAISGPNKKGFSMSNALAPLAILVAITILLGGCAVSPQSVLKPGSSTETDVEARMGPSADRRQTRNGETVRYYSRLPSERVSYAARFGADGKLISIEQRLTRANVSKIVPGKWSVEDVRDLLGPPYEVLHFPGQEAEVWTYPMRDIMSPIVTNIEFGPDRLVREILVHDDPTYDKTP